MSMRAIQTLVFNRNAFTRSEALSWARKHGYKHYASMQTMHEVRIRQFPTSKVKRYLGNFKLGKHIKAVYAER